MEINLEDIMKLTDTITEAKSFKSFDDYLNETKQYPLKAERTEILQINLGRLCNQKCNHCHVGNKLVCVDGPVFSLWEIRNLKEAI